MQPVVRIDVLWEATKCKKEFLKSLNESLAEAFDQIREPFSEIFIYYHRTGYSFLHDERGLM